MECKFEVGQQVVCIDDDWSKWTSYDFEVIPNRPIKGQKYTIRDMREVNFIDGPSIGLYFHEIQNPIAVWKSGNYENAFWFKRFKPLEEKKTDISIFTNILNKVNNKSPELV